MVETKPRRAIIMLLLRSTTLNFNDGCMCVLVLYAAAASRLAVHDFSVNAYQMSKWEMTSTFAKCASYLFY